MRSIDGRERKRPPFKEIDRNGNSIEWVVGLERAAEVVVSPQNIESHSTGDPLARRCLGALSPILPFTTVSGPTGGFELMIYLTKFLK